jgi:hypothetical protein
LQDKRYHYFERCNKRLPPINYFLTVLLVVAVSKIEKDCFLYKHDRAMVPVW